MTELIRIPRTVNQATPFISSYFTGAQAIAKPANRQSESRSISRKACPSDAEGTRRPQRSEITGENNSKESLPFPSELGDFAPWREIFRILFCAPFDLAQGMLCVLCGQFSIARPTTQLSAVARSVKRARWYPTSGGGAPRDRSRAN